MGRANLVFKKSYKPIMEEWITFMHKKVGLHNRTENLKKFPPPAVFEPTIISRFCPCLCRREIQKKCGLPVRKGPLKRSSHLKKQNEKEFVRDQTLLTHKFEVAV